MRRVALLLVAAVVAAALVPGLAAAEKPEKVEAFVCPVFNDNSAVGDKNPNAFMIYDGDYSILPGKAGEHGPNVAEHMSVPIHATNGDGTGSPPGPHSSPGDSNYTAIWNNELLEP